MTKSRYIIRAREEPVALAALAEFRASLPASPEIELVDTIGPPDQPHTLVVDVAAEQARSLEQRFRNSQHLMIERDRPLSLFP